jgi:hypothetical protein
MFYTVFSTTDSPYMQWQSELLEYSWKKVGQQGSLVRLVATDDLDNLPQHRYAETLATIPRTINPETGDEYVIYNKPASLLEWLYVEQPHGTVLLVDPDCVFRAPVKRNVAPGFPESQYWIDGETDKPGKNSPFGLGARFEFLSKHCVETGTQAQPMMIPTLIHSSDLRLICGRWLELCGYIRQGVQEPGDYGFWESDMFAYIVAAAEYGLEHKLTNLGIATNWPTEKVPAAPIIHYCQPIKDRNGETIWFKGDYRPWEKVDTSRIPAQDYGRDLVALINECANQLNLARSRDIAIPRQRNDVIESHVGDEVMLQRQNAEQGFWLNGSGRLIWELCDGKRTLKQIERELAASFSDPDRNLGSGVRKTVEQLRQAGVLED